ncbi:UdgX family uracil-DNA binding protein [Aureliella helgolandensis]|uniref:Type-4 uracil-DNA glycosylase n=1 Tax=Aureliella helgolandensis TaxID=2527968 RepID=A0A518G4T9_9BACT|nr:UdgX family uracil-DNA binding protein [Aureliella helgolandensis]QDV23616.1 Uracil DNA glycosylase superfamily protein [Aureliella helgolandensis]
MHIVTATDFQDWRDTARRFLWAEVPPESLRFNRIDGQPSLFDGGGVNALPQPLGSVKRNAVPRPFLSLAETVSFHRDSGRWNLLYRILWRLTHGEPNLLEITTDDDMHRMATMEKAVRRDSHKMKAFVRFRKVDRDGVEHYIAWHRPDHRIVKRVAPFFARRFKAMHWTILTPSESVVWDQKTLQYGSGVARSEAPDSDELEELWLTYYGSIFNPARIKTSMMKSEMPVKHWPTLPETKIIDDLLEDAPRRVQEMIERNEGFQRTATDLIQSQPELSQRLDGVRELAQQCQVCDLFRESTQTVFGVGPTTAKLVIVGEQPGDSEDLAGIPFVGPAGQLLNDALQQAGIDRSSVYVTNVVKHFKHTTTVTPLGKKRLHAKPNAREIRCCKPWLEAELDHLSEASVIVCLGATAAKALIDPGFNVTRQRGQVVSTERCNQTIATWHPAAILRTPDKALRLQKLQQFSSDLALAKKRLE